MEWNDMKFRGWDEMNKIMHNDFQFVRSGSEGNDWILFVSDKQKIDSEWMGNPFFAQQIKIIKSVGLKDKNGKEYYQGDILQEQEGAKGKFIIVKMLGGLSVHHIRYYGQKHNELIASPTNEAQTAAWLNQQEIIGNLYETPELL